MVETCRETLMTLSLTDAENANLEPEKVFTSIEMDAGEQETRITDEQFVSEDKVDVNRGNVKQSGPVDYFVDTAGKSMDRPIGESTARSADETLHLVCTPLPQTSASSDENANRR